MSISLIMISNSLILSSAIFITSMFKVRKWMKPSHQNESIYTKTYIFSLKVIDDPCCICSNEIEDCNHFFFHCHLYIVERNHLLSQLTNVVGNINITTDLLLYSSEHLTLENILKSVKLVETFIQNSGRFITWFFIILFHMLCV
jgi:hypothetical protein